MLFFQRKTEAGFTSVGLQVHMDFYGKETKSYVTVISKFQDDL